MPSGICKACRAQSEDLQPWNYEGGIALLCPTCHGYNTGKVKRPKRGTHGFPLDERGKEIIPQPEAE